MRSELRDKVADLLMEAVQHPERSILLAGKLGRQEARMLESFADDWGSPAFQRTSVPAF